MSIIMQQHPFILRRLPHLHTQLFHHVPRRIQRTTVFQLGALLPLGILLFEPLPDAFLRLGTGDGGGINPALEFGAGAGFIEVRGIGANVEGEDEADSDRFHTFLESPRGSHYEMGLVAVTVVIVGLLLVVKKGVMVEECSHGYGMTILHDDCRLIVECPSWNSTGGWDGSSIGSAAESAKAAHSIAGTQ